jgi:hypothetical protein
MRLKHFARPRGRIFRNSGFNLDLTITSHHASTFRLIFRSFSLVETLQNVWEVGWGVSRLIQMATNNLQQFRVCYKTLNTCGHEHHKLKCLTRVNKSRKVYRVAMAAKVLVRMKLNLISLMEICIECL